MKTSVKIIYTSDVHGHVLPLHYGTNEEADHGLAKYASVVKQKQKENENIIIIDNGDLIQGTPLMTHYANAHADVENPMIAIMNQIGIDAAVMGNHEFNFGKKIIQHAVEQSSFPWLAANIIDEKTGEPFFGKPYTTKILPNGVKVAVLGITTHYIPNWEREENIEGIQFENAFSSAKKWVNTIHQEEDVDLLIVSYHGGLERDAETGEATENLTGENQGYEMAEKVEGIDLLLTGHQHRILTGQIGDCLVVQAGKHAEMYGEIDIELEWQGRWNITKKQAKVQPVKGALPDENILQYIEPLEQSTQTWLDQPIGFVDGDMTITDPFQARVEKHPFIEFVNNVQLEVSVADISLTALFDNEAKGFAETVTMRDIVTNYKYPNTLVVLSLTGQEIKDALEKSATYFALDQNGKITVNPAYLEPKPQHYNYDMWENIEYTIQVSKPEGARVGDIYFDGKPLERNRKYKVVMNNYRASGGGDFDMFKNKPIVKELQQDMVEIISAYFHKHQTVQATVTKNFSVLA